MLKGQLMYSGTSNIMLPVRNKSFYPPAYRDKTRLQYYASLYTSLEVNQTFYKMPRESTIARWASEVPEGFRFSVKLPKSITHAKGVLFDKKHVTGFMQTVGAFGDKKGCLLIQFPAGTRPDAAKRLTQLLKLIANLNDGWSLAVEFRHSSWYTDAVYRLLEKFNASLVIHDIPASMTPADLPASAHSYYRFHGVGGNYRGTYDEALLRSYAIRIRHDESRGKTVYAYFNNTLGAAAENALTLQQICKEY
jgi:uncharacterized protein YecE (DUF72 family)